MNGFDLVVMVILLFCLIRGWFKGLIGEVSGIVAVIAAFYGAITYYKLAAPYLGIIIDTPEIRNLVCFCLLFILIMVLVGMVAALIRKFLQVVFLGWVDRTFGMVFGTAKGVLVVSVLFILLTFFMPAGGGMLAESRTAPYLSRVSRAMTLFISQNLRTDFLQQLEGLKTIWKA